MMLKDPRKGIKRNYEDDGIDVLDLIQRLSETRQKEKIVGDNKMKIEALTNIIHPKTRYKIALKSGILVMNDDEKLDDNYMKKIQAVTININKLNENQLAKLMQDNDIEDFEKNMGYPIYEYLLENVINKANERCKNKTLNAGDTIIELLDKLSIISVYIKNRFTIEDSEKLLRKKKNFLVEANIEMIRNSLNNNNNLDEKYYIKFLENIYSKYGSYMESEKLLEVISEIGKSNNNEIIFDFVEDIKTKVPNIELEKISKIMNILNADNANLDENKDNEKKEKQREKRLKEIRDIFNNINDMDKKNVVDILERFSSLNSDKLENYWLNYSDEKSNLSDTYKRLKGIEAKPKLKLKMSSNKKVLKRAVVVSILSMSTLLAANRVSNRNNESSKQNEKSIQIVSKTIKLPKTINISSDVNFYTGDEVTIDYNESENKVQITPADRKYTIETTLSNLKKDRCFNLLDIIEEEFMEKEEER